MKSEGGFFNRGGLDEKLLQKIASQTGGFYGRAGNDSTLRQIYAKINELEKTKVVSLQYTDYAERFAPFALAAMIALVTEIILSSTIFRKIP